MPSISTRKTGTNAIRNLYDRIEVQEHAVKYGFIFKAIPIVIISVFLLYATAFDPALFESPATIAIVSLLALALVYLFWRNELIRTTVVYAT